MGQRLRGTRVRLTLIYVAASALVAGVASAALWIAVAHFEYQSLDNSLVSQSNSIKARIDGYRDSERPLPDTNPDGIAVESLLLTPRRAVIAQSGQIDKADPYVALGRSLGTSDNVHSVTVEGRSERMLVDEVDLGDGRTGSIITARSTAELQERLLTLAGLLAAGVLGLVLLAGTAGYVIAGRALRPVRIMAATAREISERDLNRRIHLDLPPGDELGELAETFNGMLARLEAAFKGLQRFTADAAHELRAPLTLMRTQVDVTLRRDRTPAEYQASHRALLTEIMRLSRMADQLLLLARADAGALTPRLEPVELPDFLEEVVERWRVVARELPLRLEADLPMEGSVAADRDLLRRLVDNLLDNDVRHTPPGGRVSLAAGRRGGHWLIAVEDAGPGVDPALRTMLFERFTRADAARQRETGGAGLGLSLCAAIAAAHNGSIALEPPLRDGGARFVLRLPTEPDSSQPPSPQLALPPKRTPPEATARVPRAV
jgi:heavy metal sensor kinase